MSRIVLLEFSDKLDAEQFVRKSEAIRTGDSLEEKPVDLGVLASHAEVVAVVARPETFCECVFPKTPPRVGSGGRNSNWARSKNFGWLIHIRCSKPTEPMGRHFISNMLAGVKDLKAAILGEGEPITAHDRWEGEQTEEERSARNRRLARTAKE